MAGRQLLGHRRQRRRRLVVLHPAAADKLELAARDEPPDLLAAARALSSRSQRSKKHVSAQTKVRLGERSRECATAVRIVFTSAL